MLDFAIIFTTGGALLWSHAFITQTQVLSQGNIDLVNLFIKTMLLEDKNTKRVFSCQDYALRWQVHADLIFAVVYKEILQLAFVEELLSMIIREFSNKFYSKYPRKGDLFLSLNPDVIGSNGDFTPNFLMLY
jgi:hypothetical protein